VVDQGERFGGWAYAVGQHRLAEHPHPREQSRMPAGRDQRGGASAARRRVDRGDVFGDTGMHVEAVHGVKERGEIQPLLRQVALGAAAQDSDVDLAQMPVDGVRPRNGRAGRRAHGGRNAAGEYPGQRLIWIPGERGLHAAPRAAAADNAHANPFTRCHAVERRGPGGDAEAARQTAGPGAASAAEVVDDGARRDRAAASRRYSETRVERRRVPWV
jgi:hypothetical protein